MGKYLRNLNQINKTTANRVTALTKQPECASHTEIARLIEGLSRAFSLDICGYDDAYAELIIKRLFVIKQMGFSEIKISGNKASANVLLPWDVKQKIEFVKVGKRMGYKSNGITITLYNNK